MTLEKRSGGGAFLERGNLAYVRALCLVPGVRLGRGFPGKAESILA